jgi:hypothetical protein
MIDNGRLSIINHQSILNLFLDQHHPSAVEESFAHKVGLVAIAPPGQEGWPKAGVVVQEIL